MLTKNYDNIFSYYFVYCFRIQKSWFLRQSYPCVNIALTKCSIIEESKRRMAFLEELEKDLYDDDDYENHDGIIKGSDLIFNP